MSFYNLATEINEHINVLAETTTMDAITFLPAHAGTVRAQLKDFAREWDDWDIEILETDKYKDVCIGGSCTYRVYNEHWSDFSSLFGCTDISGRKRLNLSTFLAEAMEDDLKQLRIDAKIAVQKYFDTEPFQRVDRDISHWKNNFRASKELDAKIAVTPETRDRGIQAICSAILHEYGDDRGYLERLISDIDAGHPLNAYEGFNSADYIYGARIESRMHGHICTFEALVSPDGEVSESVFVDDEAIADELADVKNIKVVKNFVYPYGDTFEQSFYAAVRNAIDDVVTGEDHETEQTI